MPQEWDALFKAGKIMVGFGGSDIPSWDPNNQASYAYHRCIEPVWSSKVVAAIKDSFSEVPGVRPLRALSTPQGTLTLLDCYNSFELGNTCHTVTLFYLQASHGQDGLVGSLENWGPVKLQRLADSFRLTTQAAVYMGGDPLCCPSITLDATYAGAGTGLKLVERRGQFERNGAAAQR